MTKMLVEVGPAWVDPLAVVAIVENGSTTTLILNGREGVLNLHGVTVEETLRALGRPASAERT